jgi:putative N-acetylmannosamine-6-phosphate epimerase
MIRMIAVAFALTLASSAQAVPLAPVQQPDSMVTTVRAACGAGRTRVNGVCVARTTKRQVRRSTTGAGYRY